MGALVGTLAGAWPCVADWGLSGHVSGRASEHLAMCGFEGMFHWQRQNIRKQVKHGKRVMKKVTVNLVLHQQKRNL